MKAAKLSAALAWDGQPYRAHAEDSADPGGKLISVAVSSVISVISVVKFFSRCRVERCNLPAVILPRRRVNAFVTGGYRKFASDLRQGEMIRRGQRHRRPRIAGTLTVE
jgi:hypothetical protein